MVKILKVSKHCLRIKTRYRSLLSSATLCQCVQLQPAINIAAMHLSWAYGCLIKGALGVLREPGLQNCDKWLWNSIIYSSSCETDKRTPSTGWYHWHSSLHLNASIISVLFRIIVASALCENVCQQTSRVVYPEALQIASEGAKFCPHDFVYPQPIIWLNSCLGHTSSVAHASMVNMADEEIAFFNVMLVVYTSVQFGIPCHHDPHTALGKCSQTFWNYVS